MYLSMMSVDRSFVPHLRHSSQL